MATGRVALVIADRTSAMASRGCAIQRCSIIQGVLDDMSSSVMTPKAPSRRQGRRLGGYGMNQARQEGPVGPSGVGIGFESWPQLDNFVIGDQDVAVHVDGVSVETRALRARR